MAAVSGGVLAGAALGSAALGGGYQAYQANRASKEQAQAYGAAMDDVRNARNQALGYQTPYADVGEEALSPLTGLILGRSYDPSTGEFTELTPEQKQELFQTSPGYQARLDSALNALAGTQAARGGLFSGRAGVEAMRKADQMASDEYSNYLNQLAGLVSSGQQAATVSSNVATGAGSELAGLTLGQGFARANKNLAYGNVGAQLGKVGTAVAGQFMGAGSGAPSGGGF